VEALGECDQVSEPSKGIGNRIRSVCKELVTSQPTRWVEKTRIGLSLVGTMRALQEREPEQRVERQRRGMEHVRSGAGSFPGRRDQKWVR